MHNSTKTDQSRSRLRGETCFKAEGNSVISLTAYMQTADGTDDSEHVLGQSTHRIDVWRHAFESVWRGRRRQAGNPYMPSLTGVVPHIDRGREYP